MCQGHDEDLVIEIGEVLFPGLVARWSLENGFRLWVDGDPHDPDTSDQARAMFQTALGVLPAWKSGADSGSGSIRLDEFGE